MSEILAAIDNFRGTFFDLDNNRRVEAHAFARGWRGLARLLALRGLAPGHRVVMAVHNGPLFPAALAAVLSRGATPLLVHGSTPVQEIIRYARRISASFVLGDPSLSLLFSEAGLDCAEVVGSGADPDILFATAAWRRLDLIDDQLAYVQDLQGVSLHPTSGSTGEPKIAIRGGHCCMEEARRIIETIEVDPSDRFLVCVPMSHAYGYGTGTLVPIVANAMIVTQRRFNPRTALSALIEHKITIFPAAPAMLDLMLKAGDWPNPLPRRILAAGSPLSERVAAAFRQRLHTSIRPLYGTTETGTISIGENAVAAPGYVGRPMRGVSVKLQPLQGPGADVKDVGLLYVNSSSIMSGYLPPGRGEFAAAKDDWFNTGDLAKIDSSGPIHLVGRVKEIINVSGLKVLPREVEGVLAALDGVVEVAVYGGKHRSGSEIVKAAIVASRPIDLSEVRGHCEQNLASYKWPESISFISALPRSPAGKILRDHLP